MAAITLLSVGTTATAANSNAEVVEAKNVSRKLKRNAAIYTSHGKRTHKKYLKKGMKIKITVIRPSGVRNMRVLARTSTF